MKNSLQVADSMNIITKITTALKEHIEKSVNTWRTLTLQCSKQPASQMNLHQSRETAASIEEQTAAAEQVAAAAKKLREESFRAMELAKEIAAASKKLRGNLKKLNLLTNNPSL